MSNNSRKSTNNCLEEAKKCIKYLIENHAFHATITIDRSCLPQLQEEFPNVRFFSEEITSLKEFPDEYKASGPILKAYSDLLTTALCSTDNEIVVSVTFPEN